MCEIEKSIEDTSTAVFTENNLRTLLKIANLNNSSSITGAYNNKSMSVDVSWRLMGLGHFSVELMRCTIMPEAINIGTPVYSQRSRRKFWLSVCTLL